MPAVPSVRGERIVRALERAGFKVARVTGSHHIMRHPDGRGTTVPVHQGRDVAKGTLRGILSDIGMTIEELQRLLGRRNTTSTKPTLAERHESTRSFLANLHDYIWSPIAKGLNGVRLIQFGIWAPLGGEKARYLSAGSHDYCLVVTTRSAGQEKRLSGNAADKVQCCPSWYSRALLLFPITSMRGRWG